MKTKPLVLFLVGPTASGKSDVAIELAKLINAEIVSCDSMQVYQEMDILSAKPSKEQRKKIVHYLINIRKPNEEYSAAIFRKAALKLITAIHKRKKIPLFAGGTGLYIKALIHGLFPDKGKDLRLRKKLYKEAEKKGSDSLYERLKKIDPQAAAKIHPNDLRRIVRALEVCAVNKVKFSKLKTKTKGLKEKYDLKLFGLSRDRSELYQRIEKRIEKMFEQGVVEEVKRLKSLSLSLSAKQALGIKQISAYLNGECSIDEAKIFLKRDSRRFAKRQLSWFRQEKDIDWIEVKENTTASLIAKRAYQRINPLLK